MLTQNEEVDQSSHEQLNCAVQYFKRFGFLTNNKNLIMLTSIYMLPQITINNYY